MKFTSNELERYSKQIILKNVGIAGQKKLAIAKVLVVGVGGLGCPLLLYLANSGVLQIGLADNDKVDLSNLNRQVLFNTCDIGKFKVIQAKKFLKKINQKNIKNIIDKFDIICDCTDNFYSRCLINDYCVKTKKILISSAIDKYDGHIFNFDFKKNIPCYRCFMPEIPYLENTCDSEGLIPTVAGIAGTIQANEVIKSILQIKSDLIGSMMIFNAIDLKFRKVKLSRNYKCIANCKQK